MAPQWVITNKRLSLKHPDRGDATRRDGTRAALTRRDEDVQEPAWLFDGPVPAAHDAATPSDPDHLVQFVPGEDAIAAHKRAMKAKNAHGGKDSGGSLFPYFGEPAAPAVSSAKPKAFVAANYLRVEEEAPDNDSGRGETSFNGSRFQKFFGPGGAPESEANRNPPPMSPPPQGEDHLSRLMGVLRVSIQAAHGASETDDRRPRMLLFPIWQRIERPLISCLRL